MSAALGRTVGRIGATVRPVYRAVVGAPMEEGRLRLQGVPPLERQLARIALVGLVGLLASLLLSDLWRREGLTFLTDLGGHPTFVPVVLYPVALLGLALAWLMLLWGGVLASLPARLLVAAFFVVVCNPLSKPLVISSGPWMLRVGPTAALVIFWTLPGLLVVYSIAAPWERIARRARPVLFVLLAAGVGLFFAIQLGIYLSASDAGVPTTGPSLLDSTFRQVQSLLVPMVYLSAVALVLFAFDVADGAATAISSLGARVALAILFVVLAAKIWIQLFPVGEWLDYASARPSGAIRVAVSVAFFVLVAWAVTRVAREPTASEGAEERVVYSTSGLLALPLVINVVVLSFAQLLIVQFEATDAAAAIRDHFPLFVVLDEGSLVISAGILMVGLFLLYRRPRGSVAHETGIGLAIVGAWLVSIDVMSELDVIIGFKEALFDLLITLVVAGYALVRVRRLSGREAIQLTALVLFSWLVTVKGDFISIAGGFLGLPSVVVVIFGVVWTLLTDSAFASGDTRRFPRPSRPLLWLGYLLLAVTILQWVQVTHSSSSSTSTHANLGFLSLGIPIAVWMWLRRPFAREAVGASPPLVDGGGGDPDARGEALPQEDGGAVGTAGVDEGPAADPARP